MRGQYYQYPILCNNGTTMRGQYFNECIVGGASRRYLLDEVSGGKAGWDWDPMSASYTDPTATVDVGGTPTDIYSKAELLALLDQGQVFAISVKDQTGNDWHLEQSDLGLYPEILLDANGYPYIDGVGGDFLRADPFFGATANVTAAILWQAPSNPAGSPGMTTFHGAFDFDAASGGQILSNWWQKNMSPSLGTNGSSAFDWIDRKPRLHIFNWNSGTENIYENGRSEGNPNTTTNPTYARFTVGKNDFQNGNLRFYGGAFFDGAADPDLIAEITAANYPLMYNIGSADFTIGDSNSCTGFVNIGLHWTNKVYEAVPLTGHVFGSNIGGKTIQHGIDRLPELEKIFDLYTFTSARFVIHLGTNDIEVDNLTGAQALTKYATLVAGIRAICAARGITCEIISVTCLPRTGDAAFDGSRDDFNTGMIANAGSIYGDTIVDTTSNANLEDQNNATYFVDTTHLSATGHTELATMIAAVL